jgi:ABC-type dipeptide/oligopeptide/nickel transport system permease component
LPGDACTSYLERQAFGEALEACIKRLGLDIPAHERYLSWAYNVIQGDFGYSLSGQMQINEVLGPRVKKFNGFGLCCNNYWDTFSFNIRNYYCSLER